MNIAEKVLRAKQDLDDAYEGGKISKEKEYSGVNSQLEQILYGTDTGGKSQYDLFWDNFQANGTRGDYSFAFCGQGWTDITYNPKYPITCTNHRSNSMFQGALITDTKVPIIVGTGFAISAAIETFYYASKLVTIRELKLESDRNFSSACFGQCNVLTNLTFTGVGKIISAINLQWCPLSKESITSVVNALSSTTSGLTCTFKKTAKEAAFTTDEWTDLTATKSNWTFAFA